MGIKNVVFCVVSPDRELVCLRCCTLRLYARLPVRLEDVVEDVRLPD